MAWVVTGKSVIVTDVANECGFDMHAIKIYVGILLALCAATTAGAQTLTAYTEEWAPYNFQDGRDVKGIATDLLREACKTARLNCKVEMVPWARGYKIVRNTPDTVLFTTARKPEREDHFLWVGPILSRSTWVFARPHPADAAGTRELNKLRFGIVRGEAAYQDLLNAGVAPTSMVEDSSNASILRLLLSGVVDAMVDTEVAMAWALRSSSLDASTVIKHSKLADEGAYFYAFNLKSNPEVVGRLQAAIDKLKRQGRVDALVRRYTQP